jgi:hypothetical protein
MDYLNMFPTKSFSSGMKMREKWQKIFFKFFPKKSIELIEKE